MLRRLVRWTAILIVVFVGIVVASVYAISERALNKVYDVKAVAVVIPTAPEDIARGQHIAQAVGSCTMCHGEDVGGRVYADMGALGVIVGSNLTRGKGGVGSKFSDLDWVRAIRHGVRQDGTSLVAMPSEVFTHMSDGDLASVIAFLKSAPPVDRELPPTRFGFAGRALLAAGRLNILVAPKTHHEPNSPYVRPAPSVEYGRYLATISGCHGCHGTGLSGGRVAGPPNLPPASNLTPTGLGTWSQDDFFTALRDGRRPDGKVLDEFMPWKSFAKMTDNEIMAIWMYLKSVPPKPTGNK